ncbi:MAG: nicotinate-nucleotide diphosphorylase, partial [Gammaproteobacteria bacterium]|nr:nicotinate-nucleotide diphosphorylase [Gammaproteobacteria bacterium]
RILDTRKTIPGLRDAQKYAVTCGGGKNHRHGLYDGILIKENHIMAAGSIAAAVQKAKQQHANIPVEVEVETLDELQQAISSGADIALLDNMDNQMLREAVTINQGQIKLEASGGISLENVASVAETGVDFISIGLITKNIDAIDLSMRFK